MYQPHKCPTGPKPWVPVDSVTGKTPLPRCPRFYEEMSCQIWCNATTAGLEPPCPPDCTCEVCQQEDDDYAADIAGNTAFLRADS